MEQINYPAVTTLMKPLADQIADVLTPGHSPGFAAADRIYRLEPLLPVDQVLELADAMDEEGQQRILEYLSGDHIVIYNGGIYTAEKGLKLGGRLKEIVSIYRSHIKSVVGEKRALINLYDTIPVEDIANLTQDNVIFVMKKMVRSGKMGLAAIRYLPEYEIHFEKSVYQMPACTVAIHIDNNLQLSDPEVIPEEGSYEHPFVFRDRHHFGQRLCMGSFKGSGDSRQIHRLRFANTVNNLIKQAVQILVSGYNRNVGPANGHLSSRQYDKYLTKKKGKAVRKTKH